jgi:leader peptidase (prepilin peptidase)/N-methyltransferase
MMAALVLVCALLGLIIGSFLNVVVWRVPRGESVVRPGSRCPGCQEPIRPRDNLPVLSWLLLRGRCRDCDTAISARYPLVEVVTAALFGLTAAWFGLSWELPAFLYLAAITVALTLIDLDVKRLPNAIVLPSYVVGLVLLGGAAAITGEWEALLRAGLGMVAMFAFFFVLALIYPAGMGFGDVKLAGVLGLYLGWLGWGELVIGGFLGFLLGGVVGMGLMVMRKAGRKSAIPFGPFMLIGALLAIVVAVPLTDLYLGAVLA